MAKARKQGKAKGNRKNWVKNFKRLKQNEEVLKGLKVQS